MAKMSTHTASSLLATLAGILILLSSTTCNHNLEDYPEYDPEDASPPSALQASEEELGPGFTPLGQGTASKDTTYGKEEVVLQEDMPQSDRKQGHDDKRGDAGTLDSETEEKPLSKAEANKASRQVTTLVKECNSGEDLEISGGMKIRIIEADSVTKKKKARKGELFKVQFIAPAGKEAKYTVTIGTDSFTLQASKTKPAIKILERQIDPNPKSTKVTVKFRVTMKTRGETKVFDCGMSIEVES